MTTRETEKLQKVLARHGLGSRREMESWIEGGRVSVNGRRASLGDRASEADIIRVDGRRLDARPERSIRHRVLAYHKPAGEVTTRKDPEGRPTVFERLPRLQTGRWIAVGRLDINTAGLLLLTNDGELANRLMHPSHQVAREYAVRVFGEVSPEMLQRLRSGVQLVDGPARFDTVVDEGGEGVNHWYRVSLKEGRNREVRRLWESQGVRVSRLARVRYGPIGLPRSLRPGRWEELAPDAVSTLREAVGMAPIIRGGPARPKAQRRRMVRRRR